METRQRKNEAGNKCDYGKPRYDLIPGDALDELVKVYTYGTKKYDDNNWRKGITWGRIFRAIMTHAWKFWRGEEIDEESGLHHMAHAAWGCFALMNYCKTHPDKDDRVKDLDDKKICEHKNATLNSFCPDCGKYIV